MLPKSYKAILRSYSFFIICLHIIFLLIFCFLPLVKDLDYDFAFGLSIINGLFFPFYWQRFFKHSLWLLFIIPLPLYIFSCDPLVGLAWYFILVVPAIFIAWALIEYIITFTRSFYFQLIIYYTVWLLSFIAVLLYLLTSSGIFFFHPLLSYFQGPIYDYMVPFSAELLIVRIVHLLIAALLLFSISRVKVVPIKFRKLMNILHVGILLVMIMGNFVIFPRTYNQLQNNMQGPYTSQYCQIYFSKKYLISSKYIDSSFKKDLISPTQLKYIQRECDFVVSEIKQFMKLESVAPIKVFYYKDEEDKKYWIGAGQTQFADVFNRSIHLVYTSPFESILSHEITHILSVDFAPWYRFSFKVALEEGIAVANEFSNEELTVHEWVKAMRILKMEPKVDELFSPFFWTRSSRRAYTVSGSLVKYVINNYGSSKFKQWFKQEKSFVQIYGFARSKLIGDWNRFIDQIKLSPGSLKIAKTRFNLKGVFARNCLRRVARLKHRLIHESSSITIVEKKSIIDSLCRLNPEDHWNDYRKIKFLLKNDQKELGISEMRKLLTSWDKDDITNWVQVRILELLADNMSNDEALNIYQRLSLLAISEHFKRRMYFKIYAVQNNKSELKKYLIGQGNKVKRVKPDQDWQLVYIEGRKFYNDRNFQLAQKVLLSLLAKLTELNKLNMLTNKSTVSASKKSEIPIFIVKEIYYLLGKSFFFLGAYNQANQYFAEAIKYSSLAGEKQNLARWMRRSRFFTI